MMNLLHNIDDETFDLFHIESKSYLIDYEICVHAAVLAFYIRQYYYIDIIILFPTVPHASFFRVGGKSMYVSAPWLKFRTGDAHRVKEKYFSGPKN